MPTNDRANARLWERQLATIEVSLVLNADDQKVDNSATITDFSPGGVGVLTTLALVPGDEVKIVAKGDIRRAVPARVVWVEEAEPSNLIYAGLEFLFNAEK